VVQKTVFTSNYTESIKHIWRY